MFSGKQGLTTQQHEAIQKGPGHKRAANETTIFKELNALANQIESDSEGEAKYVPPKNPTDLTKRRMFATNADEETAMTAAKMQNQQAAS